MIVFLLNLNEKSQFQEMKYSIKLKQMNGKCTKSNQTKPNGMQFKFELESFFWWSQKS